MLGLLPLRRAIGFRPQPIANVHRPISNLHPVCAEQGQGDSFQSESDTSTIRDPPIMQMNSECDAKVILMKIERRNCSGLGRCNRNQCFELRTLLDLMIRHQFPTSPEKRVGGSVELRV